MHEISRSVPGIRAQMKEGLEAENPLHAYVEHG
jgi:hypothetical protein